MNFCRNSLCFNCSRLLPLALSFRNKNGCEFWYSEGHDICLLSSQNGFWQDNHMCAVGLSARRGLSWGLVHGHWHEFMFQVSPSQVSPRLEDKKNKHRKIACGWAVQMWIKHLWILLWFWRGARGRWTWAVLSAGWGEAAFPGTFVSPVPSFPSCSDPKRCLSQSGLALEVGSGGQGVRREEVTQKPGGRRGKGQLCPEPWPLQAKNILGWFSSNVLMLLLVYLLSLYWPNLILQLCLIYFEICYVNTL